MLCDVCSKNPATVHLTEIINDQMNELHLCEQCAHQKSLQMEQQFGLSELLGGMVELEKTVKQEKEGSPAAVKCASCGFSYADFKKVGRLGCSDCYATFKRYLGPLLKKVHGSIIHFGKSPFKAAEASDKKTDLHALRNQLQKAIESEEFEEAAKIRDKIKELEKKTGQ